MITNDELDWATDLPLTEAWKVVQEYNSIIKQLEAYPTAALVQQRISIETKHYGITWLIQYKRLHPVRGEIPLAQQEELDDAASGRRTIYIKNFLQSLKSGEGVLNYHYISTDEKAMEEMQREILRVALQLPIEGPSVNSGDIGKRGNFGT